MVRSEQVRTLFDSTQSQESKSEVSTKEFYAAMRFKTHLRQCSLSQLPVVQSEQVRTFFNSTKSQESDSQISAHSNYALYLI